MQNFLLHSNLAFSCVFENLSETPEYARKMHDLSSKKILAIIMRFLAFLMRFLASCQL